LGVKGRIEQQKKGVVKSDKRSQQSLQSRNMNRKKIKDNLCSDSAVELKRAECLSLKLQISKLRLTPSSGTASQLMTAAELARGIRRSPTNLLNNRERRYLELSC
jgi:hypothetical protein